MFDMNNVIVNDWDATLYINTHDRRRVNNHRYERERFGDPIYFRIIMGFNVLVKI